MSSSKKHKGCLRRVLDMVLAVVVAVVAVFAITNVVTIVGSKGSIVTAEKASIGDADAIVVLGASRYVTNGVAHARLLAQKGCKVFLVGGLLRPETEAIIGAAALHSLQQYNFTKAFLGANGVALDAGFTTPDPEEAAVKAAVVRRAREAWFLVDDSKFARVYPAVIAELSGGAILTNHCPNPKYRQFTLVKEAAE